MELDLTTFLMEIANFLILLWILNRLFYKPVRRIIAERQAAMERIRSEAERIRAEATVMGLSYQGRLVSWDAEKAELRRQLQVELASERQRLKADLAEELSGMRDKDRVAEERRAEELARLSEDRAIVGAGRFASRLLSRVATPELDDKLMEMLLEDLCELPEQQRQAIADALDREAATVKVVSAHPFSETLVKIFEARFRALFPPVKSFSYTEDATLLSGIRVIAGPWNLAANLKDELAFFRGGINGD